MKSPALILILCLNLVALIQAAPDEKWSGPVVSLNAAGPEIFPKSWLSPAVNAHATILDEGLRERSEQLVARALTKYPAAVLRTHLKQVYVVGRLAYSGVPTGGTNSRTAVYLANSGKASDAALEGIFHAEFSSILLRNLPQHLDTKRWLEINPPDFHYLGSGVQAIKQQRASQQLDANLQKQGFMHAYAQASLEEDFNTIAARLLMGDAALWRAAAQFPKVKQKTELVMAFYGRLEAQFTHAWFEALRAAQ